MRTSKLSSTRQKKNGSNGSANGNGNGNGHAKHQVDVETLEGQPPITAILGLRGQSQMARN